jgi:hypothetical protein
MQENEDPVARLELIERLVAEGRRTIERWGWVYVLWGVGHLVGVAASFTLPALQAGLVWAGVMSACGIAMGVVVHRMSRLRPRAEQRFSRSLDAVWFGFGAMVTFLVLTPPTNATAPVWFATYSAAYGAAFFASGHIAEWRAAKLNGIAWWAAAVAMKFLDAQSTFVIFAAMAAIGEIGFGFLVMAQERKAMAGAR